jgi:hypothetical protein
MTACASCGFDPSSLTVQDAVATLRSLPRRWRELADRVAEEDPDAAVAHRRRAVDAARFSTTADEAEGTDAEAWKEPGRLDALRATVHDGVHDLRLAERAG